MQDKKLVVIGGGHGTDVMLGGLKRYTGHLTVLISTFDASTHSRWHDDGGAANGDGSAILDHNPESGQRVPSSLLALGADAATRELMERLFAHRLLRAGKSSGHTFGSLFLSALTEITGAADLALQAAARVLNVQGQVLPVTLQPCPLIAHLDDGTEILVNTPVELAKAAAHARLRDVRLAVPTPALEAALTAIRQADVVVIGPALFHFDVLAPLQLTGMREALAASRSIKIFVCDLRTEPYVTGGWPASKFIRSVLEVTRGLDCIDYVIVNSNPLPLVPLDGESSNDFLPVRVDLEECFSLGLNVIVRPVAMPQASEHDPEKLVRTILFLGGWRSGKRTAKPAGGSPDHRDSSDALPIGEAWQPA